MYKSKTKLLAESEAYNYYCWVNRDMCSRSVCNINPTTTLCWILSMCNKLVRSECQSLMGGASSPFHRVRVFYSELAIMYFT